jgi:hypothetical protein
MEKYLIFEITGGIGKNVMATSVVSSLQKKYIDRKIILVTAWPDVWINNPNVYRIYSFDRLTNFYQTYVHNKDVKIFKIDPYSHQDYILKRKHLIQIWCDICEVEYDGSSPQIYLNPLEIEVAKIQLNFDKPIMLIHANGGISNQKIPYSWYRDLPYSNGVDVVNQFKTDYNIYQIAFENQPILPNVTRLNMSLRHIFATFLFSTKRLLIDSFSQHISTALQLPSTVVWIGNKPEILGYNIHKNIICDVEPVYDTYHSSYLEDFDITGSDYQFPYNTLKLFDSEEIINTLK